mgnify:FL=1
MVKEAVDLEKAASDYFMFQDLMDISARKLKSDDTHKEQFIQDYLTASGYADEALKAATKERDKKAVENSKRQCGCIFHQQWCSKL